MSLSVEEKVRVAQILDTLGVPDDRGRLPDVEPEGARAVRAPAREAGLSADVVRVRDDAAARRGGGRGRRAARAGRVLDAGLDDRRQDLGPAPREGRQGRPRGEPADDRRVGRVPGGVRQARDLRRRALLRRLPRRRRVRHRVPAGGAGRGRREPDDVRHQRRLAAARDRRGGPRRAARAAGRRARHPHPQRRRVRAWRTRSPAIAEGAGSSRAR